MPDRFTSERKSPQAFFDASMVTVELVELHVDVLRGPRGCEHRHGHQDDEAAEAKRGDQPRSQPHFLSTVPAYDIQPNAEHPVKTGDCAALPRKGRTSPIFTRWPATARGGILGT